MGSGSGVAGVGVKRATVYSEALGAEMCRAVAAGRSVRSLCEQPGWPHRTTVALWKRAYPDFAEAMRLSEGEARVSARMRDRQRKAEAAVAQAAKRAVEGPPARGGKASGYTRALAERICERLAAGESLTAIGRDPDMPGYNTILKWVKARPAFEAMYVEARATQAEYLFDEARDVALAATKDNVTASRLQFDVIRWQAARLAPKKYLERLVLAEETAEARVQARAAAQPAKQEVVFHITRFEVGPNNTVLAAPPRNAEEAQAWIDATGAPYAPGVGPKGQVRGPALQDFGVGR